MVYDVAIIGGGASGLTALITLLQNGVNNVVLLERLNRVGKKIIATGNGQGNLMNESLSVENFHSNQKDFPNFAISTFGKEEYKSFLRGLGISVIADSEGRVYPLSKQASSVLDFMRAYLDSVGAQIKTDFFVTKIAKKDDLFTVVSEDGQTVKAKYVIYATGGNCQKQFGTDGSGYKVLTALGHTVTKLYPALVQLKTETEKIKSLKGLKADAIITAFNKGTPVATATGEVLFTDYGISGNAVFKISGFVADENDNKVVIQFIPELTEDELKQTIVDRKKNQPYLPTDELLTGLVNKMVGKAIIKYANGTSARDIANSAKNFTLTVKGTTGFNSAQVTKGGIDVKDVSSKTMESSIVKNLYIVGEVLDVDGDCGGYNLQWAFSSAQVAVNSVLDRLGAK